MAQPYLNALETLVADHIQVSSTDPTLSCKHFFSGAALYVNGNICASLTAKGLAFKLPGHRADDLIRSNQAEALRYFDKSPIKKGYVLLANYETRKDEITNLFTECLQLAATP
jgi:hypothetical protein